MCSDCVRTCSLISCLGVFWLCEIFLFCISCLGVFWWCENMFIHILSRWVLIVWAHILSYLVEVCSDCVKTFSLIHCLGVFWLCENMFLLSCLGVFWLCEHMFFHVLSKCVPIVWEHVISFLVQVCSDCVKSCYLTSCLGGFWLCENSFSHVLFRCVLIVREHVLSYIA